MIRDKNQKIIPTFGFLVHPRDFDDVYKKYPILKVLPNSVVGIILRNMSPVLVSKITGLKDREGNELLGYIVSIPITAKQMLKDKELAVAKMKEALLFCENKGIKIVGLGALTASLSHGGQKLNDDKSKVVLTTGRIYTAKTVFSYAKDVIEKFQLNTKELNVGIVGASGSIGSGCLELLLNYGVKNFTLVDIERKKEKLQNRLNSLDKAGLLKNTNIKIDHKIQSIQDGHLIITATNTPEAVISSDDIKKEGVIIINDAQPSDLAEDLYSRNDVLIIEGGIIKTPGIKCNFNLGLADKEETFSCLGEVLVLAYNNIFDKGFDINEFNVDAVKEFIEIEKGLNFSISQYQNKFGYVDEEKVLFVKNKIKYQFK